MPADELREAVKALMGQAKDDLAELVSFQSVADPKQFPAEECEKAKASVLLKNEATTERANMKSTGGFPVIAPSANPRKDI